MEKIVMTIRKVLLVFVALMWLATAVAAADAFTLKQAQDAKAKYDKAKADLLKSALQKLDGLRDGYVTDLTAARKKALLLDDLNESQRILAFTNALTAAKGTDATPEPAEAFQS